MVLLLHSTKFNPNHNIFTMFFSLLSLTRQTTNSIIKIKRWVLVDRQFIAHPIHKYCLPSIWYHWEYHSVHTDLCISKTIIHCMHCVDFDVLTRSTTKWKKRKNRRKSGEKNKTVKNSCIARLFQSISTPFSMDVHSYVPFRFSIRCFTFVGSIILYVCVSLSFLFLNAGDSLCIWKH